MVKRSSASSVAKQAKSKAHFAGNVSKLSFTRIEEKLDPTTNQWSLLIIFQKKAGLPAFTLDVSFLLDFPNLKELFAEAFSIVGITRREISLSNIRRSLNRGFLNYLRAIYLTKVFPSQITDEILIGFRQWLFAINESTPLARSSISNLICVVRTLTGCINTGPWAKDALSIASRVPYQKIRASSKNIPTEVLNYETLSKIIKKSEMEVLRIEERWSSGRELLSEGKKKLKALSGIRRNDMRDYADFSICLARLDELFPSTIPSLEVIRKRDANLYNAIVHLHGKGKVTSYLQPTPRDIIPFVLLISICTVFNLETVLTLEWPRINRNVDRAGAPAIKIIGLKGRATKDPVRLFDKSCPVSQLISLDRLLNCLETICERVRQDLDYEHFGRIFIYVPQGKLQKPASFGTLRGHSEAASSSINWKKNFTQFVRDNDLPKFTARQLRSTLIDMVQLIDGSLEAAQKIGNHRHPSTVWSHYTSAGVKNRYRERIGQVILLRERWNESEGKIDPRRLVPTEDKGAATPGFICLDPCRSPRPNQSDGKLCMDYGACPSCPQSAARPNDPASVSYYLALEQAIYQSHSQMLSKTWLERWGPVQKDLQALLAKVPSEVMENAKKLSVSLPMVG